MTDLPSKNTKYSLIGLGALGLAVACLLLYNLGSWIAGSAAIQEVTHTCNVLESRCTSAYHSSLQILGNPQQLLFTVTLAALILAVIRAATVIVLARRAAQRYHIKAVCVPKLRTVLEELNAESFDVRVSEESNVVAFTYGVLKPVMCLSGGVIEVLSTEELSALVAHEIAHIKRRDNLAIFVALFVRDFLWPLPVSHHLLSIFIHEKEFAADDFAVSITGKPVELASAIVSVSKAARSHKRLSPAYATFFSDKATAKTRVHRLLGSTDRVRPSAVRLVVSIGLSIVILAGAIGLAYAQPYAKSALVSNCKMGGECTVKNKSCCRVN
ncbi:MAG TPA: M56 family metallopeptidase [Candidatus Aquicultor sp.]|jgi:Zn-dependent protease with chaperone function